jgi:hypothetical protein
LTEKSYPAQIRRPFHQKDSLKSGRKAISDESSLEQKVGIDFGVTLLLLALADFVSYCKAVWFTEATPQAQQPLIRVISMTEALCSWWS